MDSRTLDKTRELDHVIDRLVTLHQNLSELLQVEYDQMATVDVHGLGESAHAKEVLLGEIWNHEQLRLKIVAQLAPLLKINPATASLQEIGAALPAYIGERYKAARDSLQLLMERARELNARNMAFAESSLARIEELKRNVLGANGNNSENYSSSGARQPILEQGGRLLSTEA